MLPELCLKRADDGVKIFIIRSFCDEIYIGDQLKTQISKA